MTDVDYTLVRGVERADVRKAGRLVASLRRTGEGVAFTYEPEYVGESGRPVCPTLPVGGGVRVTPGGAVPPFFAGLLPEGRRLTALRQTVKTSADDELSLLLAVGGDAIGDVQIVAGETLLPAEEAVAVTVDRSFAEIRFADVLEEAGVVDPSAIPGVQAKGSAKGLSLPIGTAGDRFILKLDPLEHPNIVANEAYFLRLAADAGIPVADATEVVDVDGRPGLLVRRFDRVAQPDGTANRLECFDACQLLDRWPADKYNVSAAAVVAALAVQCGAPVVAARDAFRQLVFAWLTGNGDVHAKNLSVLRGADGETRLSPAYDLPSTVPYGDMTMALSIDGRTDGLSRRQWIAFGERVGVRERAAGRVIDDLLAATAGLSNELMSGVLPFDEQAVHSWAGQLRDRRRLVEGS